MRLLICVLASLVYLQNARRTRKEEQSSSMETLRAITELALARRPVAFAPVARTQILLSSIRQRAASVKASGADSSKVALVTGATRGIGRGIAVELGRAGYTVYTLGRSSRSSSQTTERSIAEGLDRTVESAAEAVNAAGGIGVPFSCDFQDESAIKRAVEAVKSEHGRLDVLVCSAFTSPPGSLRDDFWKQDMSMWDACNGVGVRSVYATCLAATPLMIETAAADGFTASGGTKPGAKPPHIVLVSSFGGKAYTFNVAYGVGKAAVDRLARDMSFQLKKVGVVTSSLYPGVVKTEGNLQMEVDGTWAEESGGLDLSTGETPEFSGKAVTALRGLSAEKLFERSGNVEVVAELAKELEFYDVDGSRPSSIRSLQYLLPNYVFPAVERESGQPLPDWIKDNVPDFLLPWSVFAGGPPPEPETP